MKYVLFVICILATCSEFYGQDEGLISKIVLLPGNELYDTVGRWYNEPVSVIKKVEYKHYPSWRRTTYRTLFSDSSYVDSCISKKGSLESVRWNYFGQESYVYFEEGRPTAAGHSQWLRVDETSNVNYESIGESLLFNNGALWKKWIYDEKGELQKFFEYESSKIVREETHWQANEDQLFKYFVVTDYFMNGKPRRAYITENDKLVGRMIFYDTLGVEFISIDCLQNRLMSLREGGKEVSNTADNKIDHTFYYYNRQGELKNKCSLRNNSITFSPSQTEGHFPIKKK